MVLPGEQWQHRKKYNRPVVARELSLYGLAARPYRDKSEVWLRMLFILAGRSPQGAPKSTRPSLVQTPPNGEDTG